MTPGMRAMRWECWPRPGWGWAGGGGEAQCGGGDQPFLLQRVLECACLRRVRAMGLRRRGLRTALNAQPRWETRDRAPRAACSQPEAAVRLHLQNPACLPLAPGVIRELQTDGQTGYRHTAAVFLSTSVSAAWTRGIQPYNPPL